MFQSASNVSELIIDSTVDFSNVTDSGLMFYGVGNNTASGAILTLNSLNFSSSTSFDRMFSYVKSSNTLDLSTISSVNVTNFNGMFQGSKLNGLDISGMNMSSATNISNMFSSSNGGNVTSIDLSTKNLSNLGQNGFSEVFNFNKDVTSILLPDLPSGLDFYQTFYYAENLVCLNKLDTTGAYRTYNLFNGCSSLTAPDSSTQSQLTDDANGGLDWTNPNSCP